MDAKLMTPQVTMYRLELRFGWGVIVWRMNMNGQREVLRFFEDGKDEWTVWDPGVVLPPTMLVDDGVLNAICDTWRPPEDEEPALGSNHHLVDSIGTRDRLLTLVETMVNRDH